MALTWIRTHDWDEADWRDTALCRDTSPELFFPIGSTGMAIEQINAAKNICTQCPSAPQCLDFALLTNQENGIWGGYSEEERRQIRRERVSASV